ncbi:MAG TPA: hypothetical protein ENN46_01065 [Candidatus Woesearchaeota archaeon]|nr:hypothetical protein [Candidatus Woesearchaeota archaeon]
MKKNKALTRGALLWLILSMVCIIVLMVFVWRIMNEGSAAARDSACLISVSQAADWGDISRLNCPPSNITIKSHDENKILSEIADSLETCWLKMGQGKKFLVSSANKDNPYHFCIICTVMHYEAGESFLLTKDKLFDNLGEKRYWWGESYLNAIGEEHIALTEMSFTKGNKYFIYYAFREPSEGELSDFFDSRTPDEDNERVIEETIYFRLELGVLGSEDEIGCSFELAEQTLR